jgi:predicted nucleic acid-binding protein
MAPAARSIAGAVNETVFVDTSAWYSIADASDRMHVDAVRRLQRLRAEARILVTTNHVTAETYTLMRMRGGHSIANAFLQRCLSDRLIRRAQVDAAWEHEAELLLARYADQDFSYADAASFVAMRHLGIEEALSFDHHFLVAGFTLVTD